VSDKLRLHRGNTLRRVLVLSGILVSTAPASRLAAQAATTPSADVATIDGIMRAVYDVISGPVGQKRDWDRMRALFAPGARLIPTGKDQEGKPRMRTLTLEEYIAAAGPSLEKDGFFEVEVGRVLERYGNIVHLMSAYESRHGAKDPAPFARGVNSFQLWFDGTRWWVVTIYWQGETPDTPIPPKYLKK
jgi:hypothetical protein